MRKVAVVGVGMSKFGELWELNLRDLVVQAGIDAIKDANLEGSEIQALYGGTMASGRLIGQEHIAALIADSMGLTPIPATRVEGACASGSLAFRNAYFAVASGAYNCVVAGGVEKMTDATTAETVTALGGAGDQEWELLHGATFPGLYALMARRHMIEYGTTEEMMAAVAVKNHANAVHNKYAQFRKEITIQEVLDSKMVADPLKILDCSPISDGAAVAVLMDLETAKKHTDDYVEIVASAQASDTVALHDRTTLTSIKATQIASRDAYKQAGISPHDVDVAEVHDCFTIAEIMAVEDLGFFEKGKAGKAILDGATKVNGEITVNSSGGLKACGHPVGATGIKQVVEIVWQLRGKAEGRQVKDAEYGLTHNVGGSGATCVVHIFKKG
ncbi:MAG: thiolase domain-containing protein [Candidatus Micrarchaeia archaeon]